MSTALTLYHIENELEALLNTEELVPAEEREQYEREVIAARLAAVDKRDAVAHFRQHLKHVIGTDKAPGNIDIEIRRLRDLKHHYEAALERLDNYIADTIRSLGTDNRDKYKLLEGNSTVLSLQANGGLQKLDIYDAAAVPGEYCEWVGKLTCEDICYLISLSMEAGLITNKLQRVPSNDRVRAAINAGVEVPGARLLPRGESVRVR